MPKISLIIALSLAATFTGCASPEQQPPTNLRGVSPQAAEHVISGAELRNAMHRLNNLVLERNLTEPELDNQRQKLTTQVREVTQGAENSLTCILALIPSLKLDADELKLFNSLANDLREEVKTLRAQTETHQFSDIPITLKKMNVTCTSCHEQFRRIPKDAAF
ncbi:MAG: hypothetical protein PHH11_16760 [Methylomonas sp.]|nr:hypothetical protein [Methylomonas sp.]